MVQKIFTDAIQITKDEIIYKLNPIKEGGYVITVVDYPSCSSQGETIDEALFYAEDALLGCLEVDIEEGLSIPRKLELWFKHAKIKNEKTAQNLAPQRTYQSA